MKIVDENFESEIMTSAEAKLKVQYQINNTADNVLYVIKYNGKIISLSGRYYKFAYKTIGNVRTALSLKFGRDLAYALIESDILTVEKVYL